MFVQRSVQACFPLAVWGSQHNMDRAIAVCEEVTRYKRYESASLHTLSQGFRLGDFAMFQYDDQKSARTSLAERKAREEYFQEFLYWFTDQWLFDLLAVSSARFSRLEKELISASDHFLHYRDKCPRSSLPLLPKRRLESPLRTASRRNVFKNLHCSARSKCSCYCPLNASQLILHH